MNLDVKELTHLLLRWVHVFAGILWVGTTYYFTWLDGRFTELLVKKDENNRIWMVHSGGFYLVEKQRVPNVMPEKLHWFRWEAAITWLSGFLLLGMVYYDGHLLVETEGARISPGAALGISLASLAVAWLVYDLLWNFLGKSSRRGNEARPGSRRGNEAGLANEPHSSPPPDVGGYKLNEMVGVVISCLLIVGTTYGLFQFFASRAACLQLGAMLGTIMTANVWMRILPAQRRMVAALKAGREPDQAEAFRAKTRSKHNTFIVIPVVFLMISPHFPGTYRWTTVSILVLLGLIAAKFVRRA